VILSRANMRGVIHRSVTAKLAFLLVEIEIWMNRVFNFGEQYCSWRGIDNVGIV